MKECIEITKRMKIKKCGTNNQSCIHCGEAMQKGSLALTFNNSSDKIVIKKNLWVHLRCATALADSIKKSVKNNQTRIFVMSI